MEQNKDLGTADERRELAEDENTAPEILRELANDENIGIRACVAGNHGTPADFLCKLANDKEEFVRETAREVLNRRSDAYYAAKSDYQN